VRPLVEGADEDFKGEAVLALLNAGGGTAATTLPAVHVPVVSVSVAVPSAVAASATALSEDESVATAATAATAAALESTSNTMSIEEESSATNANVVEEESVSNAVEEEITTNAVEETIPPDTTNASAQSPVLSAMSSAYGLKEDACLQILSNLLSDEDEEDFLAVSDAIELMSGCAPDLEALTSETQLASFFLSQRAFSSTIQRLSRECIASEAAYLDTLRDVEGEVSDFLTDDGPPLKSYSP
jgi:hypothetical protein